MDIDTQAAEKVDETLLAGYNRVLEQLASGASLSSVLEVLACAIEHQVDGLLCSVLLLDKDGRHLRHGAAPSLSAEYTAAIDGVEIGPAVGSCGTAAYLNRRVVAENIESDPRWRDFRHLAARHGLGACWSQPIVSFQGAVLGTFAMYYRRPRRPSQCELRLIDDAAHLAGLAIERKRDEEELNRAYEELEQRVAERTARLEESNRQLVREVDQRRATEEHLRSLASELALAEERERRRLGVSLHDGIGQTLGLAEIKLRTLTSSAPPEMAEALGECTGLLSQISRDARSLVFELSPPVLYDLGFEAAVAWLVEQHQERYGPRFVFSDDDKTKPLAKGLRVILFRAVREILMNVVKHARAHRCTLSLGRVGDEIAIDVEDDGVGFEPAVDTVLPKGGGGFGLFSIREQLGRLGGRLVLRSRPGEGTRVRLWAPLTCDSATETEDFY